MSTKGLRFLPRKALGTAMAFALLISGAFLTLGAKPTDHDWVEGLTGTVYAVKVPNDLDEDGLPDTLENTIGSDPSNTSTLGHDVPDGWIHQWFGTQVDWSEPRLLEDNALVAPAGKIPAAMTSDAFDYPTVADLYAYEATNRPPSNVRGAWWLQEPGLDPRNWDNNADGVADAWLLHHGLDPLRTDVDTTGRGDPSMTLREKWAAGLDPMITDYDADGLDDKHEILGSARLRGIERRFEPTDPKASSTVGTGIPDGFLVALGLNPHDADIASKNPTGKGLTVAESFNVTKSDCERTTAPCAWRTRIQTGNLADPTKLDANADGVPEVWMLRAVGPAAVFLDARATPTYSTKEWDQSPWDHQSASLKGVVADAANPRPAGETALTLAQHYAYLRPAAWQEERDGPWWKGLAPTLTARPGSLPPAVALRGWNVTIDPVLGRPEGETAPAAQIITIHVTADPRANDTDEDGLTDVAEYFGVAPDGTRGPRTNPSHPDTDGDGLTDHAEVTIWHTDPVRRDTAGAFLTDGAAVEYWNARFLQAQSALQTNADAQGILRWLLRPGENQVTLEHVARLLPTESLLAEAVPNVLNPDVDADGFLNGQELQPGKYLDRPSGHVRPSTDPARADTDDDGLPDTWEVDWSQDLYYNCNSPCNSTVPVQGWPIDPSRQVSVNVPGKASDWDIDLSQDQVRVGPESGAGIKAFSNGLAYTYELHPFEKDTNKDGISDMFALTWGVDEVPQFAVDAANEQPERFAWTFDTARNLAAILARHGVPVAPEVAFIDPTKGDRDQVTPQTNLLGLVQGREKGVWVVRTDKQVGQDPACLTNALPSASSTMWRDRAENAPRAGRQASCWQWIPYPLKSDVANGTNPWLHDFDADGLPDAWEFHYSVNGLVAGDVAEGSILGGCTDPGRLQGLPPLATLDRESYCITNLDAHLAGTNPLRRDTDAGGLDDWWEVALGLNPLSDADDHGTEDWDGDGIINRDEDTIGTSRLDPDTDGDGLLDGDLQGAATARPSFLQPGNGDGDLCLRRGPDGMPNMANRPNALGLPAGTPTRTQLYDQFTGLGILQAENPGTRCPAPETVAGTTYPYTLLKREGTKNKWVTPVVNQGAGKTTSSLDWASSSEGIPDGWLVYWRDSAGASSTIREALDPRKPVPGASDADSDLVSLADEYAYARPADWQEPRDGAWWGGLDPTRFDTDGDGAWIIQASKSSDRVDDDADNDGIPDRYDPDPAIDAEGAGIIGRTDLGPGYATDYTLIWDALEARADSSLEDADENGVPAFLDRARVTITHVQVSNRDVAKSGPDAQFQVTGIVETVEPALVNAQDRQLGHDGQPTGARVHGATVKAYLVTAQGQSALVGFAFTHDGSFDIQAHLSDELPTVAAPPEGATVEGQRFAPAANIRLHPIPSPLDFASGPAQLLLEVEANDPTAQALGFGPQRAPWADAYKAIPFAIPQTGATTRAIALIETSDGPTPDEDTQSVVHVARAIFPASASAGNMRLFADTAVTMDPAPVGLLTGQELAVTGTFLDAGGSPMTGRDVTIALAKQTTIVATQDKIPVDEDGRFQATFQTAELAPGGYDIRIQGHLLPDDAERFLRAPLQATAPLTLNLKTRLANPFQSVSGNGPTVHGARLTIPADQPLTVQGILLDHEGNPVAARPIVATTRYLTGGGDAAPPVSAVTASNGTFAMMLGPFDSAAQIRAMRVTLKAADVDGGAQNEEANLVLDPLFSTRIHVEDATGEAGRTADLIGKLTRPNGEPLRNQDEARFLALDPSGERIIGKGTDAEGNFRLPVNSPAAGTRQWSVQFLGDPDAHLAASPIVKANTTHATDARIVLDPSSAKRGHMIRVTGSLSGEDGLPLGSATLRLSSDALGYGEQLETTPAGAFTADLPAADKPGLVLINVTFRGTASHRAATQSQHVTVRLPTDLAIRARDVIMQADGRVSHPPVVHLEDDEGNPLSGRPVSIQVTTPNGTKEAFTEATDADGDAIVHLESLAERLPGKLTLQVHYSGGQFEEPDAASAAFKAAYVHLLSNLSAPREARPGQDIAMHLTTTTASTLAGHVPAQILVNGIEIGRADLPPTGLWTSRIQLPQLANGTHSIEVRAFEREGMIPNRATASILAVSAVDINIEIEYRPDGSRLVHVQTTRDAGETQPLVLTIARVDDADHIVGIHSLALDPNGLGTLEIASEESGTMRVLSLGDASSVLGAMTLSVGAPIEHTVARQQEGTNWLNFVGAAAALIAAAIAILWIVHERRVSRALRRLLREAHALALDASTPPATAVRRAYERFLLGLAGSGHRPEASATPTAIATHAQEALGLPSEPVQALTELFERATYSTDEFTDHDRAAAVDALIALASHVGDPLVSISRQPNTPTESTVRSTTIPLEATR